MTGIGSRAGKARVLVVIYFVLLPLFLATPVSERIEAPLLDWQIRWHAPNTSAVPDPRIAIIDIDEETLSIEGRWPWPRQRIGVLLRELATLNPALIASDILFPDHADDAGDQNLSKALEELDVTTTLTWSQAPQALPNHPANFPAHCQDCPALPQIQGWITNIPALQNTELAHITPIISPDGYIRRIYPLACQQGNCVEMLALSLVRQLYHSPASYSTTDTLSGLKLSNSTGDLEIPLAPDSSMLIPWYSHSGDIEYISATDILQGQLSKEVLTGRILIIGSSALGLYDQINTPLFNNYPAVEAHARLLQALLDQSWWTQPQWGTLLALIFTAVSSLLLWFADQRHQHFLQWTGVVGLLSAWSFISLYLSGRGIFIPLTAPLISLVVISGVMTAWSLLDSLKARDILRRQFTSYVPESIVDRIINSPDKAIGVAPERHNVSVLFADLRSFSRFAETLEPEQLSSIMQKLMDQFTEVIYSNGGTVDKYMGDCIMAFWGAPLNDPDHACHAVKAARELCQTMRTLSQQPGMPDLALSVGINSGEVVIGDFGSSRRKSYTVMGAPVNLAAHLEAATRSCDTFILAGDSTRKQAPEFEWQPPIQLMLGNRTSSITAWPLDPFS